MRAPAMLPEKPPVWTACSVASTAPPKSTSVRSIIAGVHGVNHTLLLLVRQFAGEETVDVVRIVGEQQKRDVDGLRLGDAHRLTRPGRFKSVKQTLVAVAGKRLGVNAVGVEGGTHPKQSRRGHAPGEATA